MAEITEEMLTAVLRVLPIDPDDSTAVVRVSDGGTAIWGDPHRLAKDVLAAAWPHIEAAVRARVAAEAQAEAAENRRLAKGVTVGIDTGPGEPAYAAHRRRSLLCEASALEHFARRMARGEAAAIARGDDGE